MRRKIHSFRASNNYMEVPEGRRVTLLRYKLQDVRNMQ